MVNHPNRARVSFKAVEALASQLGLIISRSRVRQDDGLARMRWHATRLGSGGYGYAPQDGDGVATLADLHEALQARLARQESEPLLGMDMQASPDGFSS